MQLQYIVQWKENSVLRHNIHLAVLEYLAASRIRIECVLKPVVRLDTTVIATPSIQSCHRVIAVISVIAPGPSCGTVSLQITYIVKLGVSTSKHKSLISGIMMFSCKVLQTEKTENREEDLHLYPDWP